MGVDYYGYFVLGVRVEDEELESKELTPSCGCNPHKTKFCPNCGAIWEMLQLRKKPEWIHEDNIDGFDIVTGTDARFFVIGKRFETTSMGRYSGGCDLVPDISGYDLPAYELQIRAALSRRGVPDGTFGFYYVLVCSY
jgi:hypothetical protein